MDNTLWFALIKGYTTTAGLIIAIGAQNAFILKQGLIKSYTFLIAVLATIIDSGMILLGVAGFGMIITSHPYLMLIAKYGGGLFLFGYGCKCFYSMMFKFNSMNALETKGVKSLKATVTTLFAISFLNPHMYIDTLLLIGTIGCQLPEEQRIYYIFGAIIASATWFFSLSYGARLLIPIFRKPIAWKFLDMLVGIIMWYLAAQLLWHH